MTTKTAGDEGERLAREYLQGKGYALLGQNVRLGRKELDLVMQDGETLVFVEVKARSTAAFGTPAEFVNREKRRNLTAAAEAYLQKMRRTDARCRFDVVEVYLREGRVNHIADAFTAE